MKKAKLVIPKNRAEATAEWLGINNVRLLLSFSDEDFFAGTMVVIYCAVPDEVAAAFQTEFASYIKKV